MEKLENTVDGTRIKMSHCTACVSRMKNPSKGLSKIVTTIYDPRDMNHLNNFLFFPVLDLEIRSFNMASTVSRLSSIDDVDAGFVVFLD